MVNLIATRQGYKPVLIRNIQPLRKSTLKVLELSGWVVKQWEPAISSGRR